MTTDTTIFPVPIQCRTCKHYAKADYAVGINFATCWSDFIKSVSSERIVFETSELFLLSDEGKCPHYDDTIMADLANAATGLWPIGTVAPATKLEITRDPTGEYVYGLKFNGIVFQANEDGTVTRQPNATIGIGTANAR